MSPTVFHSVKEIGECFIGNEITATLFDSLFMDTLTKNLYRLPSNILNVLYLDAH